MYKPGKETSTRIEFRCPDPACNPYLAFSVMLAAGLEGIKNKYKLPEPIEENIFEMDVKRREEAGIETLPNNLYEAVKIMEGSKLVKETLGDHIFQKFIDNKKIEWDRYRTHVSKYELDSYLSVL
jgi:glutamine synthetase